MPTTGLIGPFKLDANTIASHLLSPSAGAYALGRINDAGSFAVAYVGRADTGLAKRLEEHAASGHYSEFQYGYFRTAQAAFLHECQMYHDYLPRGLDNKAHPERPQGTDWKCPRCAIYL